MVCLPTSCGARASSVFLNDTTTSIPTRENITYTPTQNEKKREKT
jgi:hypothetical protein